MKNKTLGLIVLLSYAVAVVSFIAGSYTVDLTPWDMIGGLSYTVGFVAYIWGGFRLLKK